MARRTRIPRPADATDMLVNQEGRVRELETKPGAAPGAATDVLYGSRLVFFGAQSFRPEDPPGIFDRSDHLDAGGFSFQRTYEPLTGLYPSQTTPENYGGVVTIAAQFGVKRGKTFESSGFSSDGRFFWVGRIKNARLLASTAPVTPRKWRADSAPGLLAPEFLQAAPVAQIPMMGNFNVQKWGMGMLLIKDADNSGSLGQNMGFDSPVESGDVDLIGFIPPAAQLEEPASGFSFLVSGSYRARTGYVTP